MPVRVVSTKIPNSNSLHSAIQNNDLDGVKHMMAAPETDLNARDAQGGGPLHIAIRCIFSEVQPTSLVILECLLENPRITLGLTNSRLETPFDLAIQQYVTKRFAIIPNAVMQSPERFSKREVALNKMAHDIIFALNTAMRERGIPLSEKYYSRQSEEKPRCIQALNSAFNTDEAQMSVWVQLGTDRTRLNDIIRDAIYPEVDSRVREVLQETEYYEKIADRHHYFFKNDPESDASKGGARVNYSMTKAWTRLEENERILMAMLGNRDVCSKLPQEVADVIRFYISGNLSLSRHPFYHLRIKPKDPAEPPSVSDVSEQSPHEDGIGSVVSRR